MIKRIRIKDYMAHKDTDLELDPGVTVLTGPNNSGKSAVVEALRSVAQNPPPHHVIRHGASQAVVRVELDSGEAVEWVRSKSNPVYRLYKAAEDGVASGEETEVYAKFGRVPPEDVRRLLRLDLVETESGAVDIHIGNQRYPIFLLDQTGSQAASFFAASTEAEYLLRIQQALKTRTDRARSKRKELLQECAELEAWLERFTPLTELERDLAVTETLHAGLVEAQLALPQLQRRLEVLAETGRQVGQKASSLAALEELTPPPRLQETTRLELTLQDLQGLSGQAEVVAARAATLTPLRDPPVLGDTTRLDTLIRAWESDETTLNGRVLAGEVLTGLILPPVLHGVREFEATVHDLERTQQGRNRCLAAGGVLEDLGVLPELFLISPLETLTGQLRASRESLELCAARSEALGALSDPPQLHPLKPLEELAAAMNDVQNRLLSARRCGDLFMELAASPELQAVAAGEELMERMIVLLAQLETNARLQEKLTSAIADKRQEIAEAIQKLGLCPLCGQRLDMDHFLEVSHG